MPHETYLEWIDLEADGALPPAETRRLAEHLESCSECRSEQQRARSLTALLASSRVEVDPGFRTRVLAELPRVVWQARQPRAWAIPAAVLVALAGTAGVLLGRAAATVTPEARFVAALSAIGNLLGASLVAGAGLAAASWRGVRLALVDALSGRPLEWIAAAILVVGANLLVVRLLSRRARASSAERPR